MQILEAKQALEQAKNALQRGDPASVRRWAALAARLAPESEDPWLLLAAVAGPRASLEYLDRALKLNPASPRARAGLAWARQRAQRTSPTAVTLRVSTKPDPGETVPQVAKTIPVRIIKTVAAPPSSRAPAPKPFAALKTLSFILLPILLVVLLALAFLSLSPAGSVLASQSNPLPADQASNWAAAIIPKATATPTATPTSQPTPTPTLTPEALPTALPTDSGAGLPQTGQPAPDTGGKSILVDISEQHLYAYENGALVFSFVASTGMGNSTRVGTFAVQSKIPNAYGATWNIWMPNWLGIYYSGSLENGIHALPILSNGSTLWAGYLGTPVSFGCVVLDSAEAQQLYDWAEIGTPVIIQW
jgi:lipoprotein-anchoring transpeptidase ErfK/SrfK